MLEITKNVASITDANDRFKPGYHYDYRFVRHTRQEYLAIDKKLLQPTHKTINELSHRLIQTLTNWGAGGRKAPQCRSADEISTTLSDTTLHGNFSKLINSHCQFQIIDGRRCLAENGPFADVGEFDACYIETLQTLSTGIFVGNTNVTYPMKALLLLTGFMPAFDSQVKGGLAIAGVTGVNRTQYLMPKPGSTDAKKICTLPFYMAECVSSYKEIIDEAVKDSKFDDLLYDYGRIFDILLFQQKNLNINPPLVTFIPPAVGKWYDI